MTTTPEQIQAWREEFESQALPATDMRRGILGDYSFNGLERQWQGYLCAKQETEKAIKDARKQALEDVASILIMWTNSHSKSEILEGLLK